MNGFVIKVFWSWWQEVLEEIEEERQGLKPEGSQNAWGEGGAAVLVACKDDRMCLQLQDVLARGPQKVRLFTFVCLLVHPLWLLYT
jgi:hypothetical protein